MEKSIKLRNYILDYIIEYAKLKELFKIIFISKRFISLSIQNRLSNTIKKVYKN